MPQRCPFCKTRLWTDPWFSGGDLRCPRCGNEFKPTVHWGYFRLMVLLVVLLAMAILIFLPPRAVWVVAFVIGLGLFLWLFPRLADLTPLQTELTTSEGTIDADSLKDQEWDEKLEEFTEKSRYRHAILIALVLALVLVVLTGLRNWLG